LIRTYIILAILLSLTFSASAHSKHKHKPKTTAFTALSFLVADRNGNVLSENDSETVRPVASITKLMISLIASEQDQTEQLAIPSKRVVQSSIPRNQQSLSRHDLISLALIKSDNFAAQILCNNLTDCVNEMNRRAANIGMTNTHYSEPTGLSIENVSTAVDLLKLMMVASKNPIMSELSSMPDAQIETTSRTMTIRNTNPLTRTLDVVLSKTGFTNPAGGCLVMVVNSPVGQRFLILLGSRNTRSRIPEMLKLYNDLK
jgi:D-alanyl-D-alanine endopeptidase (penicillin-binding protein 7)